MTVKSQAGDPRYLSIINECEDRRAKILGTYAPERHGHIDYTQLTDEQIERIRNGEDETVVLATSSPQSGGRTPPSPGGETVHLPRDGEGVGGWLRAHLPS